jgi:hypothetical protein
MSNSLTPQVITPFNVDRPVYNVTGKDLIKIRKLELSSQERQQLITVLSDFMPVIELLGGVAVAQKMYQEGWFGDVNSGFWTRFTAWLEGQGLELTLAAIIGMQTLNKNQGAVAAVGTATGNLLSALLPLK